MTQPTPESDVRMVVDWVLTHLPSPPPAVVAAAARLRNELGEEIARGMGQ